jgi:ubiquinol-cytochrome c reductase cytochrome b subunit
MNRLLKKPILNFIENHPISFSTPFYIFYMFNFFFFLGFFFFVQLITGIFLAMHYAPHVDYAFASVEHIMRDVPYG